ncbi:ribose-5-phosphate isomerase A [Desulfosarcina sp.]|uniref:ribose-5-phosphate isomerase A n=1 Tax=Desulfosarcina sp. TaxID=2027861 RepID=UPI003970E19F
MCPTGHGCWLGNRQHGNLGGSLRCGKDGKRVVTDQGKCILDCRFGPVRDAAALAERLKGRCGIVEHGLFPGMATDLIVAGPQGIDHRTAANRHRT